MTRKIKSMGRMDAKNSRWSAIVTGQEVETRALGAVSVHLEHRFFHHRGASNAEGHTTWVHRKQRRDCPGNPYKLGMEVLKRMGKREPPRPGQE